jgi:hypothetical protein
MTTRSSIPVTACLLALVVIVARTADTLPEGQGLAARYPNDIGIASDPAVIFTDDFESYGNGADLATRWTNVFQLSNVRIATESGGFVGGGKALEFTVPVTSSEVSNSVSRNINPELDVLFLRYYAKYDASFDVLGSSHNGGVISAHYCCPGQRSDGFNKFLVSYEASRFAAAKANPGELNAYVYHPDMRDVYGDHFHPTGRIAPYASTPPFSFGPEFVSRSEVTPVRGRWYAYELMVKANTPGRRDGRIALWLDGILIAEFPNLRLRDTSDLKIDRVALNMHVRAVTRTATKRWYDDVVAATSYIGPMMPGPPRTVRSGTTPRFTPEAQ